MCFRERESERVSVCVYVCVCVCVYVSGWEYMSEYDSAGYVINCLLASSLTHLSLAHKHTHKNTHTKTHSLSLGCGLLGTHCFEVSTSVSPLMHLKELDWQRGVSTSCPRYY